MLQHVPSKNPPWNREELILALDLYFALGTADRRDPRVVELSNLLRKMAAGPIRDDYRNPVGVSMKLANFAALDPSDPRVALPNVGRLDEEIWDEFAYDRGRLASEASAIRAMYATATERFSQYWAFLANPEIYRIEDAIENREVDQWTTKGRPVRAGDRVLIWKARGRDAVRGIVALGEVITNPVVSADNDNPYWVSPGSGYEAEERVEVRYIRPPGLPLWLGSQSDDVLNALSVSRARGGTVFSVSPEQWNAVIEAAGGWISEPPEVSDTKNHLAMAAGKRSGQGFQTDPHLRKIVESHAMQVARKHYESMGWDVEDVSSWASFDYVCTQHGKDPRHVEVKGTTGSGASVVLTPNEVKHARSMFPNVALIIVAGIATTSNGEVGDHEQVIIIDPWSIDDGTLTPLGFTYSVPRTESD